MGEFKKFTHLGDLKTTGGGCLFYARLKKMKFSVILVSRNQSGAVLNKNRQSQNRPLIVHVSFVATPTVPLGISLGVSVVCLAWSVLRHFELITEES